LTLYYKVSHLLYDQNEQTTTLFPCCSPPQVFKQKPPRSLASKVEVVRITRSSSLLSIETRSKKTLEVPELFLHGYGIEPSIMSFSGVASVLVQAVLKPHGLYSIFGLDGASLVLAHLSATVFQGKELLADEDLRGGFAYGGWATPYQAMNNAGSLIGDPRELLFGRWTYELFHASWGGQTGNSFSEFFNAIQKYVVTRQPSYQTSWQNSRVIGGDTDSALVELHRSKPKELLVFGSGQLVSRYILLIHPLVLGAGHRWADGLSNKQELTLEEVKATPSGVLITTYSARSILSEWGSCLRCRKEIWKISMFMDRPFVSAHAIKRPIPAENSARSFLVSKGSFFLIPPRLRAHAIFLICSKMGIVIG